MKTEKKGLHEDQENLTWEPELFQALLGPGPGTMYPLNPSLVGPGYLPILGYDLVSLPLYRYGIRNQHQLLTCKSFKWGIHSGGQVTF